MSATRPDGAKGEPAGVRGPESLYRSPPTNGRFRSGLEISGRRRPPIRLAIDPATFPAAVAAHGTPCFKMMGDAVSCAANGLISAHFLLTGEECVGRTVRRSGIALSSLPGHRAA